MHLLSGTLLNFFVVSLTRPRTVCCSLLYLLDFVLLTLIIDFKLAFRVHSLHGSP